ncbi:MAG: ihfA [Francisellaceae bacterium]|nr:ihfA [Francisellaceae bacterium]
MTTVTKKNLRELLVTQLNFIPAHAHYLVDNLFYEIANLLEKGEEPRLPGLGKLSVKSKTARPGRNPKTLAMKIIKARKVVTFKPAQPLKKSNFK